MDARFLKLEYRLALQRSRDGPGDHQMSEPLAYRRRHGRTIIFPPKKPQGSSIGFVVLELPPNLDSPGADGQRPVLCRVGGEFMQRKSDLLGCRRRQRDRRSGNFQLIRVGRDKGRQLRANEIVKLDSAPRSGDEQVVDLDQGIDPGRKRRLELRECLRPESDLAGYALDDGKQVLRSVRQFSHDKLKMLFVALALGNIRIRFEDGERRSVGMFMEIPMALRDDLLPVLGVLYEFPIPAAVPEQDLLYFL